MLGLLIGECKMVSATENKTFEEFEDKLPACTGGADVEGRRGSGKGGDVMAVRFLHPPPSHPHPLQPSLVVCL